LRLVDVPVVKESTVTSASGSNMKENNEILIRYKLRKKFWMSNDYNFKKVITSQYRNNPNVELDSLSFDVELRKVDIHRLDDRPIPAMGCQFFKTKD